MHAQQIQTVSDLLIVRTWYLICWILTPPFDLWASDKYVYLHKNSQAVKRCGPCKKRQHKKSHDIQGGGPEVAVMVE